MNNSDSKKAKTGRPRKKRSTSTKANTKKEKVITKLQFLISPTGTYKLAYNAGHIIGEHSIKCIKPEVLKEMIEKKYVKILEEK